MLFFCFAFGCFKTRKLQLSLHSSLKVCDVVVALSSEPQVALSPEHEDGIIPDSPVLASSLPVANKLKKRKYMDNSRHVHYSEDFNWSLFKGQLKKKKSLSASEKGI